jgi:hypothetical protein
VAHGGVVYYSSYLEECKEIFPEAVDPAGAKPIGTLIVHPDGAEARRRRMRGGWIRRNGEGRLFRVRPPRRAGLGAEGFRREARWRVGAS